MIQGINDTSLRIKKNIYIQNFHSASRPQKGSYRCHIFYSNLIINIDDCISVLVSGSIIRTMRRLEEVLRQLCQAAMNIGNTDLEIKFSEAIKLLKRDIVFAASLYM